MFGTLETMHLLRWPNNWRNVPRGNTGQSSTPLQTGKWEVKGLGKGVGGPGEQGIVCELVMCPCSDEGQTSLPKTQADDEDKGTIPHQSTPTELHLGFHVQFSPLIMSISNGQDRGVSLKDCMQLEESRLGILTAKPK